MTFVFQLRFRHGLLLGSALCALSSASVLAAAQAPAPPTATAEPPQDVAQLWAGFDPRADPLATEVIRDWREGGMVLRAVRFLVGTFNGHPARMAAFYGFPVGTGKRLPAVMHIHGGGQRADLDEVRTMVARGYAALSVNWGGREMEQAQPGDLNTDWGVVDPTQTNAGFYNSLKPGPKQLFADRDRPENCNWYLLTIACRRGLTFLERQPEVDAERLGVHGLSMGGNLTMYVAGTDARVKAAVPAVGGQGWRNEPHHFLGGTTQQEHTSGDSAWFSRTLGFESYAPRIHCPLLHRSATNDFHGWMDDVYRTDALITGQPLRHSWSPHFNHRLTPEVAVTMPLWFDHFLRGGPDLPETPASAWTLATSDGVPVLRVAPTGALPVARCVIYYSLDPDPRDRFWRSATVERQGATFTARLPVPDPALPLFAFANVFYTLPKPEELPHMPDIREVCLSTQLHHATAAELGAAKVRAVPDAPQPLFSAAGGWGDWYRLEKDNPDYWQCWTHAVADPGRRGPAGARLRVTATVAQANRLCVIAIENDHRDYRGPRRVFVCARDVAGQPGDQPIDFVPADFTQPSDGAVPASWAQLDLIGLCTNASELPAPNPIRPWQGAPMRFASVAWVTP